MKKSLSMLSAAVLAASCLSSTVAFAEGSADGTAAPVYFYMKMRPNDAIETDEYGTLYVKNPLEDSLTLTVDIYFKDSMKSAWSVSPKWNIAEISYENERYSTEDITISKVYNPLEDGNLAEYAYAEKDSNGNLTISRAEYDFSVNKKYGSQNFTVRSNDGKALVPYGDETDDYPLISFDITIDSKAGGNYELFFTDDEDNSTRCAMDASQNHMIYKFPDCPPDISGLNICVPKKNTGSLAEYNFGDINLDDVVDASDASLALVEYAATATGKESTLDEIPKINGDVNFDTVIDASDASDILRYYAYTSTTSGELKSLVDFFGREIPENLK